MHRDDLVNITLQWVWGACIMWNMDAKQFDSNSTQMQEFIHRTHSVVWRYLTRRENLDGSCSDLECDLALKAAQAFGQHFKA